MNLGLLGNRQIVPAVDHRFVSVPAVRQKLHLSSCADFRGRLLAQQSHFPNYAQYLFYEPIIQSQCTYRSPGGLVGECGCK
jgi:hypothetical protein